MSHHRTLVAVTEFWRQGALQDTGCKRRICPFKHAIQVHCCLSLRGILHFAELFPQILHQIVIATLLYLFPCYFQGYWLPHHACYDFANDANCCCPLDGLIISALHFALLTLAHLLLRPRFVEPSPRDLEALLLLCPSRDKNFIGRSMMVRVRVNSLRFPQMAPN